MSLALGAERTVISHLRIRGGTGDAMQAGLRASTLLASASFSPPGMSPASVLIVRKFSDPRPGKLTLSGAMQLANDWEQAVRARMAVVAQRAQRPARSAVSADAEAVLFADDAELAACLVRDWLRDSVAGRWWWRGVLGDASPRQWLARQVLARGEVMVPVISMLSPGDTLAWIAGLDEAEVQQALAAIARSHGLSVAHEEAAAPQLVSPAPRDAVRDGVGEEGVQSAGIRRLVAVVPELRAANLAPPWRRLIALVLALNREPAWTRSRQFGIALRVLESTGVYPVLAWMAEDSLTARDGSTSIRGIGESPSALKRLGETVVEVPTAPNFLTSLPDGEGIFPHPSPLPGGEGIPTHASALQGEEGLFLRDDSRLEREGMFSHPSPGPEGDRVAGSALLRQAARTPVAPEQRVPEIITASRINTEFGGIFYLLNAALAMQFYSDFTAPRGANLKLSPWDWLALMGRAWFGREFVRDPVWGVLANLAGRKQRSLRRPRWFNGQMKLLLDRLALALVEQPVSAGPEMRAGAAGKGDSPLNHSHGIAALLCRAPAQVEVSASRVDVHISLSDLAISIRIAGLDRDPGWIPAAGRAVYFHFD